MLAMRARIRNSSLNAANLMLSPQVPHGGSLATFLVWLAVVAHILSRRYLLTRMRQAVVSCSGFAQGCDGGFAYLVAKQAQPPSSRYFSLPPQPP